MNFISTLFLSKAEKEAKKRRECNRVRISHSRGLVNESCKRMAQLSSEFYVSGATSSNKVFSESSQNRARKCIDVVNALGEVSSMIESIEKEFAEPKKEKKSKALNPPQAEVAVCQE